MLTTELFDPYSDHLVAEPFETYRRLRAEDPVHWSAPFRAWVLTRRDDVQAILNDKDFENIDYSQIVSELAAKGGRNYDPLISFLKAVLFFKTGKEHVRLRRYHAGFLNRVPIAEIEPVIRELATAMARNLAGRCGYDAVQDFAEPLPHYVMAHVVGLPPSDVPVLMELMSDVTMTFDILPMRAYDRINAKVQKAFDVVAPRIAAGRATRESGLFHIYEGAEGHGESKLNAATATALFIWKVGAETTTGLLGSLFYALLVKPELRGAALHDPALMPLIVSELLRLEGAVQRSFRVCRATKMVGGRTIRAGQRVLLLLGAANRDPEAFDAPDEVALKPRRCADVAFGGGGHYCLGANLARLEGRIALEQMLLLPPVEQAGEAEWFMGRSIRRLVRLPVRVVGTTGSERTNS